MTPVPLRRQVSFASFYREEHACVPIRAYRSAVAALGAAALVVGGVMPAFAADADLIGWCQPFQPTTADPLSGPCTQRTPAPDTQPQSDPAPRHKPSWKQDAVEWYDNGSIAPAGAGLAAVPTALTPMATWSPVGMVLTVRGVLRHLGCAGAQLGAEVPGTTWIRKLASCVQVVRTSVTCSLPGCLEGHGDRLDGQGGAWYYGANGAI